MQPAETCQSNLSREKIVAKSTSQNDYSTLQTPHLKFDFLLDHNGLISQLRKPQLDVLLNFLKSSYKNQKNTCKVLLNIGTPGLGKTSLIKQALRILRDDLDQLNKQPKPVLKVINFNGYSISKCQQLRRQLKKTSQDKPEQSQDSSMFINIVLIEEIQNVVESNDPESLKRFFEIFTEGSDFTNLEPQENQKQKQKYLLLGTSNTLNLELILAKKVGSIKKIAALHYPPYSVESLIEIAKGRIQSIKQQLNIQIKIPEKALKFMIMKLQENKKDDTRNLVEVIKEILLFVQNRKDIKQALIKDEVGLAQLTMEEISSIPNIRGLLNPSKSSLIEKLSFKQQLVLALIYTHLKKNDAIEISELELVEEFKKNQKTLGITAYEDVRVALNELQTYSCIKLVSSKKTSKTSQSQSKRRIILKISTQDIKFALSGNPVLSNYFKSENYD